MRKNIVFFVLVCLVLVGWTAARSEDPLTLAVVSGGSTGKIFRVDTTGPVQIFSAKKGFRPEGVAADGSGRIFICDTSGSQVHVLEQDPGGDWDLTTIFDKGAAVPPSPEQPVGCAIVGPDLFFGERSGSQGGGEHGLWVIRDAVTTPTAGPFNAPELLVSLSVVSGDDVSDITFGPDSRVYMAIGSQVYVAGSPDYDTFELLVDNLAGEASGLAINSVGEIFVSLADLGIIEVFDAAGSSCGIYADLSPLRPKGMQFDLGDDLYVAAPRQSNDRNGDVFVVAPNEGPSTHQCNLVPGFATAICSPPTASCSPLTDDAPDAQADVSLPLSSVSAELVFEDADALTAKLCAALFTLDPEFLANPDPDCPVTITCRQMTHEEFEARTGDNFADTSCIDIPNANGNCIEIGVEGADCFGGITEVEWFFFSILPIVPADRPGLLYAEEAGPGGVPYTENILTGFLSVVPDLPNDPGMLAKKDSFGSGLVGVIGAPNRPPVADAGDDVTVGCETGTVTIDGSASFDPDPIDDGSLDFSWEGPVFPAGGESAESFDVDVAELGVGQHTYELTVTDPGLYSTEGPLSGTDEVTITVSGSPPTLDGLLADPDSLWPPNHEMVPVTVTADVSGGCGVSATCEIVGVESSDPTGAPDDPDTGDGGGTYPDWAITGPLTVDLRAERSEGGDSVDDARVYTISVTCTDGAGNTVGDFVEVLVVSDQGG
jgi:hypothetical protein